MNQRIPPADGQPAIALALDHHRHGRLAEAEAIYRTLLADNPADPDVLHMLGLVAFQCGHGEAAADLIGRAVAIKPDDPFAWNNLGAAFRGAGRGAEAAECFRRAVGLKPDYVEAHGNLAAVLKAEGRSDEAVACFRAALALDPHNSAVLNNLGNLLGDLGRHDEAIDCLRRAIAANPANAEAHNNLGVMLARAGDREGAMPSYRQAIAIRPNYADAYLNLGNALNDCDRAEEAAACYREAVRLDPGNEVAAHLLAALTGGRAERAPDAYVEQVFDRYAESFDEHLTGKLGYQVPERLVEAIRRHAAPIGERKWDVFDLGCGTGLAGAGIAPLARSLVGVDLSANMLAKARERGVYQRLVQTDLLAAMRAEPAASYDLILAADVFVYFGALDEVVREALRLLRPAGLFAFSLEALLAAKDDGQGFGLNEHGRFAHSAAYIETLAKDAGFKLQELTGMQTRLEDGVPVQGWLVVMRR